MRLESPWLTHLRRARGEAGVRGGLPGASMADIPDAKSTICVERERSPAAAGPGQRTLRSRTVLPGRAARPRIRGRLAPGPPSRDRDRRPPLRTPALPVAAKDPAPPRRDLVHAR